jgi:uncharacterized protein
MSYETMEQTARFLLQEPKRLHPEFSILWHLGEPMSVPISFYEFAFEALQRRCPEGKRIQNCFTTNATLINQSWCDLIKRWNLKIGVSIDGPQSLHDGNRVYRSSRGTFEQVMKGVENLRSNGIPFHALCTLTNQSLDYAEDLWRFFQKIGATSLHFNPEEIAGPNTRNSLNNRDYLRLRNFFRNILELRNREAPDFFIRNADVLPNVVYPSWLKHPVQMDSLPLVIISISWDGKVSTFSPEMMTGRHKKYGDFIFGHVATHTLDEIAKSEKLRLIYREISEGIRECKKSCSYFDVCGGGCPVHKLSEHGTFKTTETLSCRLRVQAIRDGVLDVMNRNAYSDIREPDFVS